MNKITQLLTISLLLCGAGVVNAAEKQRDLAFFIKNDEGFRNIVRTVVSVQFNEDRKEGLDLKNNSNHVRNRIAIIKMFYSEECFNEASDEFTNLYKETVVNCENQFKASWLSVRPELHRFFKCKPELK